MKKVAILIDAGFFIHKLQHIKKTHFKENTLTPDIIIDVIYRLVQFHEMVNNDSGKERKLELYRIYFYDCPPIDKQIKYPLPEQGQTTPKDKNFKLDESYKLRESLHKALKQCRKIALRMGELSGHGAWQLNELTLKNLLRGNKTWDQLTNSDFHYQCTQKQVDIKLGMDITTLAYDKLVEVIVLVAGDSDFVPAAKLARTKGIDFILDPLRHDINPDLSEHIDGIQSFNLTSALSHFFRVDPDPKPTWWDEMIEKREKKKEQSKKPKKRNRRNK